MKLPCFMNPKTFVKGMNRERLGCVVFEVEGSAPAAPQFHRFQHMGDVIYLAQWKRRRLERVEEPRRLSPPPILKKRTSTQTRVDTREIEKLVFQPRSTSPQPKMKLPWSAQYPAWLDNVATKHLVGLMLVLAIVVLIIVDSTASRNHPNAQPVALPPSTMGPMDDLQSPPFETTGLTETTDEAPFAQ